MKKKRLFTTVLILMTFIVALFLSLGALTKNTIDITKDPDVEWNHPIYELGEGVSIVWPKIDTDDLSKSIVSYEGDVDKDKFETIFLREFEEGIYEIPYEEYDFEFEYYDNKVNVNVDSNNRMIDGELIKNPTHTYTYQLKTNDFF